MISGDGLRGGGESGREKKDMVVERKKEKIIMERRGWSDL
jgi:hypothetical protein